MLEAISDNVEGTISLSLINVWQYFGEFYEDEFISATGDSGLTFSCWISATKTLSIMNDVDINMSHLRILLRILRNIIGTKLFEPETKMTNLCGEMIVQQFGEYKYVHEIGSKPEFILY